MVGLAQALRDGSKVPLPNPAKSASKRSQWPVIGDLKAFSVKHSAGLQVWRGRGKHRRASCGRRALSFKSSRTIIHPMKLDSLK